MYKLIRQSISDGLATNVQQALEYFEIEEVLRKPQAMSDVGLDYLSMGQPLSSFLVENASASNLPMDCIKRAASM